MITTQLVFSKLPYGDIDVIQNPECGDHKGSEVHFFINILKYSHLNESSDVVRINIGNVSKLILGLNHFKLYKISSVGEEKLILQVSLKYISYLKGSVVSNPS